MKVLVIGHHFVVKDYQRLWEECNKIDMNINYELLMPNCSLQNGSIVYVSQNLEAELPIHTLKAPFAKQGRQHLFFFLGLKKKIIKINPDFIYCAEEANSIVTTQVGKICKNLNIGYCFWSSLNFSRNYWEMYPFFNVRKYLFTYCNNFNFKNSDFANVTSIDAYNIKISQGYSKRIIVNQTHGVSDMFFKLAHRRIKEKVIPKVFKIGFVGRLLDWKGVDILIKSLSFPFVDNYELIIYGDGPEKNRLIELCKVNNVSVCFRDFVEYCRMPDVFSKIDILVLPSLTRNKINEKFGRVLIEGMASGCVVIGSADGGIKRVLKNAGILFEPGNYEQLRDILKKLISDNVFFKKTQKNCFEDALSNHSYQSIGKQLHNKLVEKICR